MVAAVVVAGGGGGGVDQAAFPCTCRRYGTATGRADSGPRGARNAGRRNRTGTCISSKKTSNS